MQKYLNDKKVPQLSLATGATRFSDPANFPWTMAANPNYQTEARIYGRYILANHPNAKIGILYQNDDFGKDYVIGLKQALGDKAASMIVAEAAYEPTEPTVNSQIVRLKSAGADVFYDISTPKFAAQAIRKIAELDWKPVHILTINSSSVGGVLKPAGLDISRGIISVNWGKDPGDPTWDNDPGMKKWRAFMDMYYPEGDKEFELQYLRIRRRPDARSRVASLRRQSHPRERDEAGHEHEECRDRSVAAGHRDEHLAN